MHKSRLAGFIIDCQTDDLEAATRFWSAALGIAEQAGAEPDAAATARSTPPADELHLEVQQVDAPEPRAPGHRDATTSRRKCAGSSGSARGASARSRTWCVMEAPTGQRFCVVRVQRADFAAHANPWTE